MSGHSKWATTKHKKAIIDSRRAKSFAKLIKNIEVAAKIGGADLSGNPTLVDAVQKAKKTSVPNDNIDRAIKRGAGLTGESSTTRRSCTRATAPTASRCSSSASPTTRTARPPRCARAMTRNGGTMADPGSVAYNFARKGVIVGPKADGVTEDDVLGGRARRRRRRGHRPRRGLRGHHRGLRPGRRRARRCRRPASTTTPPMSSSCRRSRSRSTPRRRRKVFRLIDALEDSDDVQNVYSNFDLTPEVQAELENDEEWPGDPGSTPACALMRVLGIDPGLTRCGVGVVDVGRDRSATLVTSACCARPRRAARAPARAIADGLEALIDEHRPRPWRSSASSRSTTSAPSWAPPRSAASPCCRGARAASGVALHTPSEVKAAVTGYGAADKKQVQRDGRRASCGSTRCRSPPTPPTPSPSPSATPGAGRSPRAPPRADGAEPRRSAPGAPGRRVARTPVERLVG